MKGIKLFVASVFLLTLAFVGVTQGRANAQLVQLDLPFWSCYIEDGEFSTTTTDGCDLSIKKEVSVAGGAFFDANISGEAVDATVGDSVVYRLSVTDTSTIEGSYYVSGAVQVFDVLPSQVTYVSSVASDSSTFDQTTGTWQFSLGISTVYPLTLTINTTASGTGLVENTAFFAGNYCDGWCEYSDSNNENDSDSAWINVSAPPTVLGDSSTATPVVQGLADTGDTLVQSVVAGLLITATMVVILTGRLRQAKADQ